MFSSHLRLYPMLANLKQSTNKSIEEKEYPDATLDKPRAGLDGRI